MIKQIRSILSDNRHIVLGMVCLLPFIVPFSIGKNVDVQAFILIVTGGIAWYSCWLERKKLLQLPGSILVLVGLYVAFCFVSLIVHPSTSNALGSVLIRLGSVELLACAGIGILLRNISAKRLATWLYVTCVALAAVTLPYTLHTAHRLTRLGGLFHQADLLAVWMACGIVLGIAAWNIYPKRRLYIIASQLLLLVILILSQTRAVIAILYVVLILYVAMSKQSLKKRLLLCVSVPICIILGVIASQSLQSNRLTDASYASDSISYRFSLQGYGLKASTHQPIWGYGAGSLPVALACPTLHSPALQQTCHDGHYFNSSHNIFLDRVLGLGWIGGLAFIYLTVLMLRKGTLLSDTERTFTYCALLIALYYLTNVTNTTVEVLFWVFLLRGAKARP